MIPGLLWAGHRQNKEDLTVQPGFCQKHPVGSISSLVKAKKAWVLIPIFKKKVDFHAF